MNIHPLFVHFPIGLLALYSVLEIAAWLSPRLRRQSWLFSVKAFLLFIGALGAFAALYTGGVAEDLIRHTSPNAYILKAHAPVAGATTLLYCIICAAYLVRIFDVRGWGSRIVGENKLLSALWSFKKRFWYAILNSWLLPLIALLAFVGLTVTGALGAAIVYGPNIDPLVSFVYHLFWVQ